MFFPGYSTNKLLVTVSNQTEFPECPSSGTFEDGVGGDPGPFSQVCRDQLLTLRYDGRSRAPMPKRFSRPQGVRVWERMRCHRFRLTDNPGVDHFELPGDPNVVARLLADLEQPRSRCP